MEFKTSVIFPKKKKQTLARGTIIIIIFGCKNVESQGPCSINVGVWTKIASSERCNNVYWLQGMSLQCEVHQKSKT